MMIHERRVDSVDIGRGVDSSSASNLESTKT